MNNLRQAWINTLEEIAPHWRRKNDNTIIISVNGYKTFEAYELEANIRKHGGFVLSMEYDEYCGKTFITIKEPITVL